MNASTLASPKLVAVGGAELLFALCSTGCCRRPRMTGEEGGQLVWRDPDGIEDAHMSERSRRAERIHRLRRHAQFMSDLPDGQDALYVDGIGSCRQQPVSRSLVLAATRGDCVEARARSPSVVARACDSVLPGAQAPLGLRSRGPEVRLLSGAPLQRLGNYWVLEEAPEPHFGFPTALAALKRIPLELIGGA